MKRAYIIERLWEHSRELISQEMRKQSPAASSIAVYYIYDALKAGAQLDTQYAHDKMKIAREHFSPDMLRFWKPSNTVTMCVGNYCVNVKIIQIED